MRRNLLWLPIALGVVLGLTSCSARTAAEKPAWNPQTDWSCTTNTEWIYSYQAAPRTWHGQVRDCDTAWSQTVTVNGQVVYAGYQGGFNYYFAPTRHLVLEMARTGDPALG